MGNADARGELAQFLKFRYLSIFMRNIITVLKLYARLRPTFLDERASLEYLIETKRFLAIPNITTRLTKHTYRLRQVIVWNGLNYNNKNSVNM